MLRTLTALAFVLVLASAGTGAVRADVNDTLGASVTPTPFYANIHAGEPLTVVNIGTVEAAYTLEIENNTGWALSPTEFTLAPGDTQEVTIVSVGTGKSTLLTNFANAQAPDGMEAGAGTVSSTLRLEYEQDMTPLIGAGIVVALVAIVALGAFAITYVRRRRVIA